MRRWHALGKATLEGHASEEQLIQALDGELPRPMRQAVAAHVEACWQCRRRQDQLLRAMECFTELEEVFTLRRESQPPRNWVDFAGRLNLVSAALGQRGQAATPHGALLGAALCLAALALFFSPPAPLSAKEILHRAQGWERTASASVTHPVIKQRIRIRSEHRRVDGVAWRVRDHDASLWQWQAAQDSALRSEIESLYRKANLDLARPISAVNHAGWSGQMGLRVDDVERQGEFLRVRTHSATAAGEGSLVQVELLVRAVDGHPVEQAVTVATPDGERRYEVTELGFEVGPMTPETARLLLNGRQEERLPMETAVVPGSWINPRADVQLPSMEAEPVEAAAPAPDLSEAEIESLAAVWASGAGVMDAAHVERQADHVSVVAYASAPERKAILEQRLAAGPNVRVTVHLLSEYAPQRSGSTNIAGKTPARFAAPLFFNSLSATTGSATLASRLVSYELDHLRQVELELTALVDLDRRFPAPSREVLSEKARHILDSLAGEHLRSARSHWGAFQQSSGLLLAAVGSPWADEGKSSRPPTTAALCDWALAPGIIADARRMEDLSARAFTTMSGGEETLLAISPESLRDEFQGLYSRLGAALGDVEATGTCRP